LFQNVIAIGFAGASTKISQCMLSGFNHAHRNARKDTDIRKFVLPYLYDTISAMLKLLRFVL
jgi:hypothetical protein